ncbi:hypothetical protein [Spiroplasma floricola]|uniref:Chitinase n=1 Tax=Spiroplasma floricola 23-6 TaxID=1336749 RepID=A0A2K8SED4_9MOLU|nr:hypothetical protein [Spiroplasma floricola]AUB31715.1 hypothetical protein SFLOR_v1c06650 [Spiroplasma floricola 23-6]
MKKLLILGGVCTIGFGAVLAPSMLVVKGFVRSLEQYNPNVDEDESKKVGEDVKDSNQGYQNISVLNLKSNLGSISDISEEGLIKRIQEVNPTLKDKKIYIKALTLKKIKITVENYTGTFDFDFKITSLNGLIKNKELGKIKNIKSTTIIEKIKELNPNIAGMDFINDIDLKVSSLNEIKLTWAKETKESQEELTLTYESISLDGIFMNTDLGVTNDISSSWISNKILEINKESSFLSSQQYQIIISDTSKQTPENAVISIKYNNQIVNFQEGNALMVTYNVSDIAALIKNTNLGILNKLDKETILSKVKELNPIFAQYSQVNSSIIDFDLNSAIISNPNLANRINLTFQIDDINVIVTEKNIGNISNYSEETLKRDQLIVEAIKTSNPLLKKLPASDFIISNVEIGEFGINDILIKDVKFNLKIKNYNGTVNGKFNIRRENISSLITTKNLGKIYWIKTSDIIQKIKDKNGTNFNEDSVDFSKPSYTSIDLKAKEKSLNYYGQVKIIYETVFKKINDFDFKNAVNGNLTAESFDSKQDVPTMYQTPDDSTFELRYAIPDSYESLINAGKKNINFNLSTKAKKMSAKSAVSAAELKKYDKENISISYDFSQGNQNGEKSLRESSSIPVSFKSGFFCTSSTNIKFTSNFYYSISKTNANSIDYFVIKIKISSKLQDWSGCSSFQSSWSVVVNSIEVS